ncbi:Phenazine biosynthesis PhzC/PhzF protein [Colletotrichum higginsianum IMI 349063]|uniref:Phenazine biosynthesis PhzC/PhzF protein n=1 Tax=Colletotrichum higginsianum (strain IMI 349063) TaxID=759273 RepID=A0A1B7XUE1_COLHI|nr:Phenazine biosynthesis PhzC/PhzF protein [Colletotrichum higginsianum IMI 349063]OBR03354.1 Phenazine biosynthesis PhzC/PhzF protein [Colletotrichum higginsianum IMI 349063]
MTSVEIPFGGHPTLGAASYLRSKGITKIVTKAGPVPITAGQDHFVSALVPHNTYLHAKTIASLNTESRVGLHPSPEIREAELGAPIFSPVHGIAFALVSLPSLEQLSRVFVGPFEFNALELLGPTWSKSFMARSYYVITDSTTSGSVRNVKIRTRMIASGCTYLPLAKSAFTQNKLPSLERKTADGGMSLFLVEDPATGAAACALTSYLALHKFEELELKYELTQGVEMGRQSDIYVTVKVSVSEKGERSIKEIFLGGTARQIMKGTLETPPL